jgi:hypothetical protein
MKLSVYLMLAGIALVDNQSRLTVLVAAFIEQHRAVVGPLWQ